MSIDKNVPPFVAHFDGNQVPTMMGVEGTLGTSDTGGTARPLPVAVNRDTGAMFVQDLSGATGTTNIQGSVQITGGTFNAGTVTSNVATGTQQTLGTVGTVNGVGTITNLGSITNIGNLPTLNLTTGTITTGSLTDIAKLYSGTINTGTFVMPSGTVTTGSLTNIANLLNGTVVIPSGTVTTGSLTDLAKLYTGTINVGTFVQPSGTVTAIVAGTQNTLGTVGTVNGQGTLSNVGSINTVTAVTTVTTVSNVTNGTMRMSVGTLTTGSLTNLAGLHTGTITTGSLTNIANILSITAGTQNTLGTVGVVNNIVTGTLASVRQDYRPVGSSVIAKHTLGTGGGTFFGTILAASGAGTSVYLAGLSIVGRSGTVDCGIANNVAGSTGVGVYARGFFPPSGGIARTFNPAINLGTNGTIAYFLITAGTVDLDVEYWVAP